MSVLIKELNMPKNCYTDDCPCLNGESGYCQADKTRRYVYGDRPYWCPLVAVPTPQTGRWIGYDSDSDRYDEIKCSDCGKHFTVDTDRFCDIGFVREDLHYCPNCGAKMNGEEE